jgi:hypothetical protein
MHARHEPTWLILDISLMMIIICLGYICTLVLHLNPCRYLDEPHSTRLQPTQILSNLVFGQVSSAWDVESKEQALTYPFWQNEVLKSHSCHFRYSWEFPCLTNPCRKMNYRTRRDASKSIPMSIHHKFNYMTKSITKPKVSLHIFEKLCSNTWAKASQNDVNTSMLYVKVVSPLVLKR